MWIIEFHDRLSNTALLYTIAMAIWSLWRFFRKEGPSSNYWGALAIAEAVFLIQGILGMVIWIGGMSELSNLFMHALYGIVSVLIVPGMFLYSRERETPKLMLIFAIALLFQIGIILRGMATGSV